MSNSVRGTSPQDTSSSAQDPSTGDVANVGKSREEHNRESGQVGADEPDYGRPRGERPDPEPKSGPNSKGPQHEEGGAYPGTREPGTRETTDKIESRSDDPGQSSYGGFKNEDPSYQRQEVPTKNPKP